MKFPFMLRSTHERLLQEAVTKVTAERCDTELRQRIREFNAQLDDYALNGCISGMTAHNMSIISKQLRVMING